MSKGCDYYSKKNAFQCTEKWFRTVQSALLLFMIFCFIFYMITVGIDIAKLSADLPLLLVALSLDALAMAFIVLGVRGVALEVWPYVLSFDVAIILVTVGHGVTFTFRHTGLNAANFFFDASLAKLAILYTIMLCRFEKLKPADYDVRLRAAAGNVASSTGSTALKEGLSGVNGLPGEADQLTSDAGDGVTETTGVGQTGMELSDVIVETAATASSSSSATAKA